MLETLRTAPCVFPGEEIPIVLAQWSCLCVSPREHAFRNVETLDLLLLRVQMMLREGRIHRLDSLLYLTGLPIRRSLVPLDHAGILNG